MPLLQLFLWAGMCTLSLILEWSKTVKSISAKDFAKLPQYNKTKLLDNTTLKKTLKTQTNTFLPVRVYPKTDMEENTLLNEVVTFDFFAHKKVFS